MGNWLKNILSSAEDATPPQDILALQNQLQTLKLELVERTQALEQIKADLQTMQNQQERLQQEKTNARLEALFRDTASAVSQILTQAYLLESQAKPVQSRDILQVARQLIRALEQHGLTLIAAPGEQSTYDPAYHTLLNTAHTLTVGQPVTIRLAGVAYQGKILIKASVEPASS